jgi:uncharacterized protein YqeY
MKQALRAKESVRLAALRSIRAAFLVEMKKDGRESLPDEACVPILRRLEKQRRESIEAFESAGREDRAEAERAELAVVQSFAPSLADATTTRGWVEEAIASSGARAPGDLGRVMGALMKTHKGEVDGALARELAQELLSEG